MLIVCDICVSEIDKPANDFEAFAGPRCIAATRLTPQAEVAGPVLSQNIDCEHDVVSDHARVAPGDAPDRLLHDTVQSCAIVVPDGTAKVCVPPGDA
jgi:hypothetical protein